MSEMTLDICNVEMVVEYQYEQDNGCMYDSDGSGTPASCELEIEFVYVDGVDMYELFLTYAPKLIKEIENQIIENQ